jgi:hypothetical protein
MDKKTILYLAGAIAVFYLLKKKGILGNIDEQAMQLSADEINNLDIKIDYRDFKQMYLESEKS